ncbi:MAG: c-type cytochrome [Gallionella sp.]|nr:c-type cytochrome [Gallionella sp.]
MRLLAVTVSLGAALLVMTAAPSYAAGGDAIFKKSCASCHYTDGPAKEKTIADQLAKKGPELWYAGSKFKKDWLVAWLQNPKPIRSLKYNSLTDSNKGDHPKQSAGDAAATADFLMGLTSPLVKAGVITAKASPQAKAIFGKKMPCGGCHEYAEKGEVRGGKSGPSLVGASKRLNPDWVYAYLANIKAFKPVRDMPDFAGVLSPKDLEGVAAYMATFE